MRWIFVLILSTVVAMADPITEAELVLETWYHSELDESNEIKREDWKQIEQEYGVSLVPFMNDDKSWGAYIEEENP